MSRLPWESSDNDEPEDDLPASPRQVDGSEHAELAKQALERIALITYYDDNHPVEQFNNRVYCGVIWLQVGHDCTGHVLKRCCLSAVCESLGLFSGETTREMRADIGAFAGFDYDSPDSYIRNFRKAELHSVSMALFKR